MTRILAASLIAAVVNAAVAQQQPNVLILIADDLGADSVAGFQAAGGTPPPTPNIDALGQTGVRFQNAWAAPVCSPTRAALLTGRYGFRTGVRSVGDRLPTSETTLAEVLSAVGYENALFGKWHLGTSQALGGNDAPRVAGWDTYAGGLGGGVGDYYSWQKSVDGSDTFTVNVYATTDQVDDALGWIQTRAGTWSCIVSFNAPHTPFHDPNQSLHGYDLSSGTALLQYKAAVEAMDTEIGRLLDGIPPAVLAETLVVFVGDNGTPGRVIEAPLVHSKGSVYEGGVRVPLVISGPGVASPDRDHHGLVHVSDLFATVAEQAGVDLSVSLPETVIDGVSLAGILRDPNAPDARAFNYTETVPGNVADGRFAVRNQRYKLVYNAGVDEFYDLDLDPYETGDLLPGGLTAVQQLQFDALQSHLAGLRAGLCSADINGDAMVDLGDLSIVLAAFGQPSAGPADLDGDGVVDLNDLAAILSEFGQSCW